MVIGVCLPGWLTERPIADLDSAIAKDQLQRDSTSFRSFVTP
jgi:hypothetical protein